MAGERRSIHEVDSKITFFQNSLSTSPRPHTRRTMALFGLAIARKQRNKLLGQREDLNKSILHFTELILLPPRSWAGDGPMVLDALFCLASALLERSKVTNQPEDAIFAAKYLRHLRDHPHQAFRTPRHHITTLLVDALAFQVEFDSGNVRQSLGEMADLYRELLTLDVSNIDTLSSFSLFLNAVWSENSSSGPLADQPLDQIIQCLRVARVHKPELHQARFILYFSLLNRYITTFMNDDYEEASSILDEMSTSNSPDDFQDEARLLMSLLSRIRSTCHANPEYSEEAIYRTRAFLASSTSSSVELYRSSAAFGLEHTAKERFNYFGSIEGLEASSSDSSLSELEPDEILEHGWIQNNLELLGGLLSGIPNNDKVKIEEAIQIGRSILAAPAPDPRYYLFSSLFSRFGKVLFEAFQRTKKIDYLNESISTLRRAFDCPFAHSWDFNTRRLLFVALSTRFASLPDQPMQDLNEAMELVSLCVNDVHASSLYRFRFACEWASVARLAGHPSVSKAYEGAMSLIQDILLFAPTLQLQHATLTTSDDSRRMPLDNASYQVDLGQLEEAIVTLERGRALLWSEMRLLRAPIDQLLQVDPQLGGKFAAVNHDLEALTKSVPPSHKLSMDDSTADDLRAVDPFGRLLLKQRGLLKERDDLISQIRALPSFNSFLTPPSFDTLRSAASAGPVILINHSSWRSDILILLHNTSPSLIPTPPAFFERASALKDGLLDARNKHGPNSYHYNQNLAHVLTELYDLVGKPVIDRLRQLNVPEQSRVWWCPTSVFCSLPLHAMGPIPSDDGEERYFLDIYVSSYTPTLSALIRASDRSEPCSATMGLPSILLVAHFDVPSPEVPLSEVCEDVKVVQALKKRLSVKSLISENATTSSVLDGLQRHQLVHFICHGTLEARKPFEAGFELHGNERLTLLEIVRSHLPAAEFAFLSACHTAELTEGSAADEGLHLAAAMQYCGFRSVVGTMWAMANEDGPDVTKYFYQSMFLKRDQVEPVPYYKKSAWALRDAVKKLRKKRWVTLERWVNFVHYGA